MTNVKLKNISTSLFLFCALFITFSNSQCLFGYIQLTNNVVDSYSTLNTVCVLEPQFINDCNSFSAYNTRIIKPYQILSFNELTCTQCRTASLFSIVKITPSNNQFQYFCIDSKFIVPKCLEYVKVKGIQNYQCSKCQLDYPFISLNPNFPYIPTLICTQIASNCQNTQNYVAYKQENNGLLTPTVTSYCASCDYGYSLNTNNNYCIPSIQYCAQYSLTKCTKCIPNLLLIGQKCSIPLKNCRVISQTTGICTQCSTGFKLSGKQCIFDRICSPGQYLDLYGNCIFGSVPGCNQYDSYGNCLKCKQGHELNRLRNQCLMTYQSLQRQCPSDTETTKYVVLSRRCIGVDINCSDRGIAEFGCIECNPRYYLWRNKCYRAF